MALLSDVLASGVCESFLWLIKEKALARTHFEDNYLVIDTECGPKCGSFGKVFKVKCTKFGTEYAIKKVVIDHESTRRVHDLFVKTCQESVLPKELDHHQNIAHAHPHLNWVVLPDLLDAFDVLEVLEKGVNVPLTYLRQFFGTEFYMVFDWYPDDIKAVIEGEEACTTVATVPTISETKRILLHVMFGLCYLHSMGYIHNDLKPDNILLNHYRDENCQLIAVITDFGMSQSVEFAANRSRVKRHRYDAPDKDFSTYIDIWAFGILCFHLTFVSTTRRRLALNEFQKLNELATNGECDNLRTFIRERLPTENNFFMELVVQCLHSIPNRRPTARVVCQILIGQKEFAFACEAARRFSKLINPVVEAFEEMIFPRWYEDVFLERISKSLKFSTEIVSMLRDFLQEYDFPLTEAFQRFDIEMLTRFAEVL